VLPELPLIGSLGVNDLFSGGSHTSYSLALDTGASLAQPQSTSTSLIDAIFGDEHGNSGPSDDHHSTPGLASILPSALEELHLRGLGDVLG